MEGFHHCPGCLATVTSCLSHDSQQKKYFFPEEENLISLSSISVFDEFFVGLISSSWDLDPKSESDTSDSGSESST